MKNYIKALILIGVFLVIPTTNAMNYCRYGQAPEVKKVCFEVKKFKYELECEKRCEAWNWCWNVCKNNRVYYTDQECRYEYSCVNRSWLEDIYSGRGL